MDIVEVDTNIEEKEFIYNSLFVGDYYIITKVKNILVFWVKKSCGLVAGIASFLRGFSILHRTINVPSYAPSKNGPDNREADRPFHKCWS